MKIAIVKASELAKENRWDASFHVANAHHAESVTKLKAKLSVKEALDIVSDKELFDMPVLGVLRPLLRGAQSNPGRREFLAAAKEYPYLALALLLEAAPSVLEKKLTEAQARLNRLERYRDNFTQAVLALEAPQSKPLLQLPALPEDLQKLAESKCFVASAVYEGEDGSLVVSVHTTDKNCYVADCWVFSSEEQTENALTSEEALTAHIQKLVYEGEVPTPFRQSELGAVLGALGGLVDHTKNYAMGWRS
jgi:HAMP domain-containing protein